MSEPEIKVVVDECGRIVYRVTNEGVLLSNDEKEFIASHILHLQDENAKLRELVIKTLEDNGGSFFCLMPKAKKCKKMSECVDTGKCYYEELAKELEVRGGR